MAAALGKRNGFDIAKSEIDLLEFVETHITDTIRRRGREYYISCPKVGSSDTDPSLAIYPETNTFCCWHCGGTWNGTIVDLVMGWKDLASPVDALKFLDEIYPNLKLLDETSKNVFKAKDDYFSYSANTAVRFHNDLMASQSVVDAICEVRGISEESVKTFMLGLSDWGDYKRLSIPQFDRGGRVLGFVTRKLDGNDERPKYLAKNVAIDPQTGKMVMDRDFNSNDIIVFEKGRYLYNLPRASMHARQVVNKIVQRSSIMVAEGHLDVVAGFCLGINNMVAYGTKNLSEDQVALMAPYDEIVLVPDTDAFDVVLDNAKLIRSKFPNKVISITDISAIDEVRKENDEPCKDMGDLLKYSKKLGLAPDYVQMLVTKSTLLLEKYIVDKYLDKEAIDRRTKAGDIEGSRYIATLLPKFMGICTEPVGRAMVLSAVASSIGVPANLMSAATESSRREENDGGCRTVS